MLSRLFLPIVVAIVSIHAVSAGAYEGKIAVTMQTTTKAGAASADKFDLTVKNNQILVESKDKSIPRVLLNNATGVLNLLMDGQGQKMAIKLNLNSLNGLGGLSTFLGKSYGFGDKGGTIKAATETKEINGYKCNKFVAKDAQYTTTFWVTNYVDFDFANILGLDSKYPELKNKMLIKATGKNSKTGETFVIDLKPTAKPVDSKAFQIPGEYQQMDMTQVVDQMMKNQKPEDVKKMLLQMMKR